MIIAGAVILFVIYWFFFRNKKDTKKESSFNPDYLVIGDEIGYKKCCWDVCEMKTVNLDTSTVITTKWNCCLASNCPEEPKAGTASSNYNGKYKNSTQRTTADNFCKDAKGNRITCPTKIDPKDIISQTSNK